MDGPPRLDRMSPPGTSRNNGYAFNKIPRLSQEEELAEAYQVPGIKHKTDYRVIAQKILISDISIERKTFKVRTEMRVVPLSPMPVMYFHLGKCALLPDESCDSTCQVTVNGHPAKYKRIDPVDTVTGHCQYKNLADLNPKMYAMLKDKDYTLQILLPTSLIDKVRAYDFLMVTVEVVIKEPKTGIKFIDNKEKGSHFYTYRSPFMSGTREWLPCLDEPDQLALWELEVHCDEAMVVTASGELKDVVFYQETKTKSYHFCQLIPTSACNMGFVIGQFTVDHHPESSTLLTFSPPQLEPFVKFTTGVLDKMIEFLEELLSCRFPYPTMKVVFVDLPAESVTSYSGLMICSTDMLYHKKIIDVVQEVRQDLISGLAQQFFGCFISPSHWIHWWIGQSVARLLANLYIEKMFGTAEARYQLKKMMDDVIDYEYQWGKILLAPELTDVPRKNLHFDPRHELTCSPFYAQTLIKKGYIIMRQLYRRLGKEPMIQVLNRLLLVGLQMSERKSTPGAWKHMLTCTEAFFRCVSNVTGSEIPTFVEQWIKSGGHAAFQVKFEFNRKRNMIELEVKQDLDEGNGRLQYTGPLTVVVQELDGAFSHTVQIDSAIAHADLPCHSKGRRQKKKKVPLLNNEEVEIDLSNMDAESPVLWLRADHDHLLLRDMQISQPVYHWEYMLKYERDVIAQMEALERLQQFPSAQSKAIIAETVNNDNFFYRVRSRAAFVLSTVLNKKLESWTGGCPILINLFREQYGSKTSPNVPRPNNFVVTSQNLQQYFVMQALPQAVSRLRQQSGEYFDDVFSFIMNLIKLNDNSMNRYADDFYRAALYNSLTGCVVPCEVLPLHIHLPENLSPDVRSMIQEFTYALNMDTINPSFGRVVGVAALTGIYQLQKNGYMPLDSRLLFSFADPKCCTQMRRAAITLLVDRVSSDMFAGPSKLDDLVKLFNFARDDESPAIRRLIPRLLAATPPFVTSNNTDYSAANSCNTPEVAESLWRTITSSSVDPIVRQSFTDLYFSLYGLGVPPSIGGPAEAPGHHRCTYGSAPSATLQLSLNYWHSSSYEVAKRSPPRRDLDTSFGEALI